MAYRAPAPTIQLRQVRQRERPTVDKGVETVRLPGVAECKYPNELMILLSSIHDGHENRSMAS